MKYIILFLLLPFIVFAQEIPLKKNSSGIFSLGVRNTVSMFNDGESDNRGLGAGGQFRVQLAERVNTDWFFDYINGNISDFASRDDYHIGWSVLYYVLNPEKTKKVKPYLLAGHCFDYSRQRAIVYPISSSKRWSSAVQGGIGSHINLTPRFDLSGTLQYMLHIGTSIHANKDTYGVVYFTKEKGLSSEGHLLLTFSLNYKIVDLW